MLAYKFLRDGAVGPFSGFVWSQPTAEGPGPWVEAAPFRGACSQGIHGCDTDHLVYWLEHALWVVELDGEITVAAKKLIAPRGRLVRRIDAWDKSLARELVEAGVARAREVVAAIEGDGAALAQGYLDDAILFGGIDASASLFCAAHAAVVEAAFLRERKWQSNWLAARLGL